MSNSDNKPIVTTTKGGRVTVVQMNQPKVSTNTGSVKESGGGNQVDVIFVFDTTGSMDNKIVGLLKPVGSSSTKLSRLISPRSLASYRLAISASRVEETGLISSFR